MRRQPNRPKRYKTKPKDLIKSIRSGNVMAFYNSPEWKQMREDILKRDHWECQRCNGSFITENPIEETSLSTATDVHHIKGLKEVPELCLSMTNLVSLCHECHDIAEGRLVKYLNKKKEQQITREMW